MYNAINWLTSSLRTENNGSAVDILTIRKLLLRHDSYALGGFDITIMSGFYDML